MKRSISGSIPIPIDHELKGLIKDASVRTRLSQAAVMRSALRIGVPEVVKRMSASKRPRRNLIEYIDAFAGLVKPSNELVEPSRFK